LATSTASDLKAVPRMRRGDGLDRDGDGRGGDGAGLERGGELEVFQRRLSNKLGSIRKQAVLQTH
jgi:hypothetical protein